MLSLEQDIIYVILSRGELSKSEIQQMWGLSNEEYDDLKTKLSNERVLEIGPKGIGGFKARFVRQAKTIKDEQSIPQFDESWENAAVDRLVELFSHAELEKLLADLVYTVRRARIHMTGEDRRGTKKELASALIILHGIDLFQNTEVRSAVARKCRINAPGRWHAGKGAATKFCEGVAFPHEFAGIPSQDAPPDFEYLEGRVELKPLQQFQKEVRDGMSEVLEKKNDRAIVTLPTGAGKTRVAVDSIRDVVVLMAPVVAD